MKCKEFKDRIDELFDAGQPAGEMMAHMAQCPECSTYYLETKAVLDTLTPAPGPAAPASLKENVMARVAGAASQHTVKKTLGRRLVRIAAAASVAIIACAALVVAITQGPGKSYANAASAAEHQFSIAISSISKVENMVMALDIRTRPNENFEAIDLDEQMVPHTISVINGKPKKWRIEKEYRVQMSDGQQEYLWYPKSEYKEGVLTGYWFDLKYFLDPASILGVEKQEAARSGNTYTVNESGGDILLTVRAKAHGDFTNPYALNSSIWESDNRREYVFDKSNNLLKSLKIFVEYKGADILVLDTKHIAYNTDLDAQRVTQLPEGFTWRESGDKIASESPGLKGMPVREAAIRMLDAMGKGDTESIRGSLAHYPTEIKNGKYKGIKVISVGEPFRSGDYPGWFVPCEFLMPDGSLSKLNLAIRNDNDAGYWMLDGGI